MLFVQFKVAHGSTGEAFLFNIPKCKDGLKLVGTMTEASAPPLRQASGCSMTHPSPACSVPAGCRATVCLN